MVYAFVIHTLLPGPCRVLYHNVYGQDATYSDEVNDADHKNRRRNDIQLIANEVSTGKRHRPSHLFHMILAYKYFISFNKYFYWLICALSILSNCNLSKLPIPLTGSFFYNIH